MTITTLATNATPDTMHIAIGVNVYRIDGRASCDTVAYLYAGSKIINRVELGAEEDYLISRTCYNSRVEKFAAFATALAGRPVTLRDMGFEGVGPAGREALEEARGYAA